MMKRNILIVIVPTLLVTGTANAVEIHNKDDNKVDLYGEAVGLYYSPKGNGGNSYGGNDNMTYVRLGFRGETQTNSDLTSYSQQEYNLQDNNSEDADAQTGNKTRLTFAGLKYTDAGSFDYDRNCGVVYDALGCTDALPEFGGDTAYSGNFFVGRIDGVTTYCNSNFFGLIDGLNFAVQYLGKNERDTVRRSNGDGIGDSISYEYEGFGIVGTYGAADRINLQEESPLGKSKKAEQWATGLKYGANSIYLAVDYGGARNATPIASKFTNTSGFASKTRDVLLATQYQFDFGLRSSITYTRSRARDVKGIGDIDLVNYFEVSATCYFDKNMSTYVDYIINQIGSDNKPGASSDGIATVDIVYQF